MKTWWLHEEIINAHYWSRRDAWSQISNTAPGSFYITTLFRLSTVSSKQPSTGDISSLQNLYSSFATPNIMTVHVLDDYYLAITLLVTIGYQLFFFAIAFSLKFDKLTGMNISILMPYYSSHKNRFCWRNQFRCPSYHYFSLQRNPSCSANRQLDFHYAMGGSSLRLPSIPYHQDRKGWPFWR